MQNVLDRSLVRMLACLDPKQRKGFRQYLDCGLFNTNATLSLLYARLEAKALKPGSSFLGHKELLKGTGIAESTLDKLFSQMLSLLNSFIALWASQGNVKAEGAVTLEAWHRMDLPADLLEREYRKMRRKFDEPARDELDIFHELRLETSYAKFKANLPRKDQAHLFAAHHELLETYYQVAKLKFLCATANVKRVFRDDAPAPPVNFSPERIGQLPAIGKAYFQAHSLLTSAEPNLRNAEAYFAFLQEEGRDFSFEDRHDLLGALLNTSFPVASQGDPGFEQLVHRIYNEMFDQGLIVVGGNRISSANFKNMVSIKSRVGALQESREFIETNQHLLPAGERETLVAYCMGLVLFYEKKYREAIQKFKTLVVDAPEDLHLGLNARNMLWKSYFEAYDDLNQVEQEEMHNLYHAFRVYVARNSRISEHDKRCYQNFIRVFKRLISIGDQEIWAETSEQLAVLKMEVSHLEEIVHKKWILSAIDKRIARREK